MAYYGDYISAGVILLLVLAPVLIPLAITFVHAVMRRVGDRRARTASVNPHGFAASPSLARIVEWKAPAAEPQGSI